VKDFRIPAHLIRSIARGYGYCIASDRITVDGLPVGYAYREHPDSDGDSGWRFFSGDESQAYADVAENFEIYDVNTIANYDPEILPFLSLRPPSSIERPPEGGPLSQVP